MTRGPWTPIALVALAPLAAAQRGVADLYEPGHEAAWVLELGGERIGHNTFRYEGPAKLGEHEAHHFTSAVRLEVNMGFGPVEQLFQGELWTGDDGRPLEHVLHVLVQDSYSRVDLVVDGRSADCTVLQGGAEQEVQVPVPDGSFLQANNFIGYFELMLALSDREPKGSVELQLVSVNALTAFPYEASWKDTVVVDGEEHTRLSDSLGQVLSVSPAGRLTRIEMPAQRLLVTRTDEEFEPIDIRPDASSPAAKAEEERQRGDIDSEEVEITHGEVELAGTITRPAGAQGRLPALFFVSGSGLQDRNGVGGGLAVGTDVILDHLTRAGFLVLRVDDRGVGGSKGPVLGMGYDDLVADARACVDFLFQRSDVDPERVAVIGHSEGGMTAPLLAVAEPRIASVVLMAGVGRNMLDLMYAQNVDALGRSGLSEEGAGQDARAGPHLARPGGLGTSRWTRRRCPRSTAPC